MLVYFKVKNFKSIAEELEFNFEAMDGIHNKDDNNVIKINDYKLLKIAVLYGANASGKSNIIESLSDCINMITNKYNIVQSVNQYYNYNPFRLSKQFSNEPTSYEIKFILKNNNKTYETYKYKLSYNTSRIIQESLYCESNSSTVELFTRNKDSIKINNEVFIEGVGLENKTPSNILFLWKCDQANGKISKQILRYFNNINIDLSINQQQIENYDYINRLAINNKQLQEQIIDFIKTLDLGIENIKWEKISIPNEVKKSVEKIIGSSKYLEIPIDSLILTLFTHRSWDGDLINFPLNYESMGTKNLYKLSAPFLSSVNNNTNFIVDELDNNLHPILLKGIINYFKNNVKNAQLIATLHDVNMLDMDVIKSDQIYFTEKTNNATQLYSLADFDLDIEDDNKKQYLDGIFGAVPFLGLSNGKN